VIPKKRAAQKGGIYREFPSLRTALNMTPKRGIMAENTVTSKDTIRQENDRAIV